MIRITVDLISSLGSHRNKRLAQVDICNVGVTEDGRRGNYSVRVSRTARLVTVFNWPRKSKPVLSLVKRALELAGY